MQSISLLFLDEFRSKLSTSKPDFISIVILSHGRKDPKTGTEYIVDVNRNGLAINKIKNMFIDGHKCPSMLGKPKFFFIQACRGQKIQNQEPSWLR